MIALALALCLGAQALAQQAPSAATRDAPSAASLIGRDIDLDKQSEIGEHAKMTRSGDWRFGLDFDDPGLERRASTKEQGSGGADLSTAAPYKTRCARSLLAVEFALDAGDRFKLRGAVEKGRYADGWIALGDKNVFDASPRKARLAFSENDGGLHFKLDPGELARRGQLAICTGANPPAGAGDHCAHFSLEGFARAYDFVCDAK